MGGDHRDPVVSENAGGTGPFVIVCDHASRRVPREYGTLGLDAVALQAHIAWDPGALGVARHVSQQLDAPLLWPDVSRLVIDCNRDPAAPDLIVTEPDGTPVPGNAHLQRTDRDRRLAGIHAPYHAAIEALLAKRHDAGLTTALIAIHSFTPVWKGRPRPWQIGVVFGDDRRLADELLEGLRTDPSLTVGINQPYSPADRVYYTVERHATPRGLPAVMIEIRNDVIADEPGQRQWADRLSRILGGTRIDHESAGGVVA